MTATCASTYCHDLAARNHLRLGGFIVASDMVAADWAEAIVEGRERLRPLAAAVLTPDAEPAGGAL